ncbi:cysteine peptidase family C39 domain-containing protein [Dolosigranulum pigrum]|uniref:cysteine peptidase family C39 domain-containing protein n=1 Tax=Dolosigranulum pigrum TaxID=29394 RepID=UPI001AD8997E|nr:cysteine peptidase family C39 domain-containing protein [Dolosigranulum pigrum]
MIFRKYKYRSQINEKDCGVAALGMILDNYGIDVSTSRIRHLTKTTQDGTTMLGLSKTAQKLGL